MSFDSIDQSVDAGRPIELCQISYTGNLWFYTSADREIEFDGRTFKPVPMKTPERELSSDSNKSSGTFTFARDVEVAEIFRIQPPSEPVTVTVWSQHYLDDGFVVSWKGRIVNAEWKGAYVELTSDTIFTSMKRMGLRRRYSSNCPHALYGAGCGVSRDAFKEVSTVSGMSGLSISVFSAVGKPDNFYAGGYVTWENNLNGNVEKRMVRSSVGATGVLTLASLPVALAGLQSVTLYPGCDHTLGPGGCPKFANERRYGGCPYIPKKNPFGGTPIY